MKVVCKRIIKCILFLVILALTAGSLFHAFTPDDGSSVLPEDFFRKDKDRFDVLFLGTSKIKQGVYPMKLYEEYGISSYNLGTGDQTAALSYYLLKDVIERQHPKMVILEVGMGDYESTYQGPEDVHYITDHMPFFAKTKFDLIYGVRKQTDGIDRFRVPWYEYHSRWTELSEADFIHEKSGAAYGSWVQAQVRNARYLTPAEPDASYVLPEIVTDYMEKIVRLCEEKNTQLAFLVMPRFESDYLPEELYTDPLSEAYAIERFAGEHDLPCLNYYDKAQALGLDCAADTWDGMHLNVNGAEEFTAILGEELEERFDLPDRRNEPGYEFLAKDYEEYLHYRTRRALATDNRAGSYFARLIDTYDTENYLYILTAAGDTTKSMTETGRQSLVDMGVANVESAAGNHAYIAVIDHGSVVYETNDFELTTDYYTDRVDGFEVTVLSQSAEDGSAAQAIVDMNNYVLEGSFGLNVVIYDKETGKKVDASYLEGDAVLHKVG